MIWLLLSAEAAPLQPQEAIKAQAGCYKVTFQYNETEGMSPSYTLAEPKKSEAIEWISVEKDTETEITLQHVLVSGPAMIRHWRQTWIYEPRELFHYSDVNQWSRQYYYPDDVEGKWGQIVYNVDDAPRYECLAEWVNNDEENYWTCQTWAPLPRREKKRADYSILERENTHRIVDNGWIHEQNNTKFHYDNGQRTNIAKERGYNTYERIADEQCSEAIEWWPTQRHQWQGITAAWDSLRSEQDVIKMKDKHNGLPLWIRLFWIAKRAKATTPVEDIQSKALDKITNYIEGP